MSDNALRERGDLAFKSGRLEEALDVYSQVIELKDDDLDCFVRAQCYCNRSMVHCQLEQYSDAVQDAKQALNLLKDLGDEERCLVLQSKAYHRHAQALMHMRNHVDALKVYKEALKECSRVSETATLPLQAAALLALENMPPLWLATYWATNIARGEAAHPLSARDGILLKKVPESKRVHETELKSRLVDLLTKDCTLLSECQMCVVALWSGQYSMKSCCAFVRGWVYFSVGEYGQGERDATVALVYGPQTEDGTRACWAGAYALRSRCFEARGENVSAVLDIVQAIEFCDEKEEEEHGDDTIEREEQPTELQDTTGDVPSALREYRTTLTRLLPRIPEHYAQAIQRGCGYTGLQKMMAVEQERMQPEFMKNRPKYYYYYEWMKKRIQGRHPSISEGVMDKLLTLDATELDLLLQYPQAIDTTVQDLETVLEEQGPQGLESYHVPLLSWDTLQTLTKSQESLPEPSSVPAISAP